MFHIINFIKRMITFFFYPAVRVYVGFLSERNRLKSFGKKPRIFWEQELQGRNILLLALYEKGYLRPDILRLLETAKERGMYVFGVNTQKLADPDQYKDFFDCYIEKYNFGRDFSSYKTGFMHIYERGWESECVRVLMANDSVFYTTKGLKKFLKNMIETDVEVLGSTENFDMVHHLGSFCISFSSEILQRPKLKKYWLNYKLSDVRPTVIWRGELELSKTLFKTVSSEDNFQALFSGSYFVNAIKEDPKLLDFVLQNGRISPIFPWRQTNISGVLQLISERYLHSRVYTSNTKLKLSGVSDDKAKRFYINSIDQIMSFLEEETANNADLDREAIEKIITSEVTETFLSGSQAHQNAAILVKLGLSFIKLDGLYRGIFNHADISNIVMQLDDGEAKEVRSLLMKRPYGGKHLIGWRRVAFERGLI